MTGFSTIKLVRLFEKEADEMGFCIQEPHYDVTATSSWNTYQDTRLVDQVYLVPKDDRYPVYRRGVAVFAGTIEEAKNFFQGIRFAYLTDKGIGLSNEQKRLVAEAREIVKIKKREEAEARRLEEERIKREQKKMWAILADKKQRADDEVPF